MALSLQILLKNTAMKGVISWPDFWSPKARAAKRLRIMTFSRLVRLCSKRRKKQKPPSYFMVCLYAPINYTAIFSKPPNVKINRDETISASVIVLVK